MYADKNMAPSLMKRLFVIIVLVAGILILREWGVFSFNWSERFSQIETKTSKKVPALNAREIVFREDTGAPFIPQIVGPQEFYKVTVSYRIVKDLSPFRWVPFYKWGHNSVQLTYLVWMENGLIGCGSILAEGEQTNRGIASARDYEQALIKPLIAAMKESFDPRVATAKP